jgi:hypothetical protein
LFVARQKIAAVFPAMIGERGVLPALLGARDVQHDMDGGYYVPDRVDKI